jgi:hypothetical protein
MLLLICALCVVLAVFCSQEGMRPPLADQSFSFIHRFLYEHNIFDEVFISMMIITILMFRGFQQMPLFRVLFIGMAIYFGGRLYLSEYMSLASSPFSYHAIMQSGLVLVMAYLTVLVARRCAAFDELVKSLFVPGSARVALDFEAANDKAHHILQYCRRNGHPAGVIVLKPDLSAGQFGCQIALLDNKASRPFQVVRQPFDQKFSFNFTIVSRLIVPSHRLDIVNAMRLRLSNYWW